MKSIKNKIFLSLTLLATMFLATSCLNDDSDYWKDDVAGKAYITVLKPQLLSKGLKPVAGYVKDSFMINIATDALPTSDIEVKMKVNPAAVTNYNTLKGTAFKVYPNVEVLNPTITIAKGTRTAWVQYRVWGAETLDACDNYVAAISFESVSGGVLISSNMNSHLIALPISNPYEGTYSVVGYRIRPGNPTEPVVADETLSTVNCKSVKKVGFGNYTAFGVNIEVTSDVLVVGGTNCLKVNGTLYDATSGAAVAGGMFATFTGDAATAPTPPANANEINYYNPVTKKFVLNMYYVSSAGNRIMYEVLTRK
ncbi:MAG: DUF1735 domain-containing protein [Paludibacter sp.]